jgi:murein DD-endopeptidase MepM/ murein hydrolase activator NlpD
MADMNWLKDRNLLRLLLCFSLVYYLPWGQYASKPGAMSGIFQPGEVQALESGMGGGLLPEEIALEAAAGDVDLELSGLPEPAEFSKARTLTFTSYTVEKGDIIGDIAMKTGLNDDTLLSVNGIKNSRLLQIGQILKIPNQDGIYYKVQTGDTISSIAETYEADAEAVATANELFSDALGVNVVLFIPGARMDWVNRQEINGDLFIWPVTGYITSTYGYRANPFGGARQFHSGLDIGSGMGNPVRAAMAGRVIAATYDDSYGNYVVVSHHSGYRTLYGHLSQIRVKVGAYVGTGERIGDVGSTGRSTGPHLHFTVYKNGVTVNPRSLMK